MKRGILILIILVPLISLSVILYLVLNNPEGCGKNNFECFYSLIENDCQSTEMEVKHDYFLINRITQKFLFTLSKLSNGKCNLNIQILEYTDTYFGDEEFEEWITGTESYCEFEKEELIQVINGFEKYAKLEVLVLDGVKEPLKQNCEGAFVTSLMALRFKEDSGLNISGDSTCIEGWCFQEVS